MRSEKEEEAKPSVVISLHREPPSCSLLLMSWTTDANVFSKRLENMTQVFCIMTAQALIINSFPALVYLRAQVAGELNQLKTQFRLSPGTQCCTMNSVIRGIYNTMVKRARADILHPGRLRLSLKLDVSVYSVCRLNFKGNLHLQNSGICLIVDLLEPQAFMTNTVRQEKKSEAIFFSISTLIKMVWIKSIRSFLYL